MASRFQYLPIRETAVVNVLVKMAGGFGWRSALIVSVVAWAIFSWGYWVRERVFSPSCLILGALTLALTLPVAIERFERKKWFYAAMSMWFLVIVPTGLIAFNASVGRTVFPRRFYIPVSVLGCLGMLAIWRRVLKSRNKRRAPGERGPREPAP